MKHGEYLVCEGLLGLVPHVRKFNGFTDNRQVIEWFEGADEEKPGPLLVTSRGGERTVTTRFIELARSVIDGFPLEQNDTAPAN